ncbi:MAG TPA: Mrp/NBP35 family ATP-binding protein [Thermoanaerobaculia bacterium]|nr:Mrp/NBP35 family ATP-binding protein [Thermoanaerobaculia bacterium]
MANDLESLVWEALRGVRFPGMSRDIVSFGFVDKVRVEGGEIAVDLAIVTHNAEAAQRVRAETEEALRALPGATAARVELKLSVPPSRAEGAQQALARDPRLIPEVTHVVAVASGKGGVGKSTVAANLAVALARLGHRVGLLDADIYGPSVPTMFGIHERPRVVGNRVVPFERYGVKLMSLGFVVDNDQPVIWRGPMVMKALEQMLGDVEWGALDFLVADFPPGTGDAQLTMAQKIPMAGAVVVTTPQDVALIDARKGLAMFRKLNVPVLGIVENMASFVCPHCGEETAIFKQGGGERTAAELQTDFLGRIPLDAAIVEGGDAGVPIVVGQPDGPHALAFRRVAEAVVGAVDRQSRQPMSIV